MTTFKWNPPTGEPVTATELRNLVGPERVDLDSAHFLARTAFSAMRLAPPEQFQWALIEIARLYVATRHDDLAAAAVEGVFKSAEAKAIVDLVGLKKVEQ